MTVRLELASSSSFPQGSPSRAYILRVPVKEDGQIDGAALARSPWKATARRFWSAEPDRFGHVEAAADGDWHLRWARPAGGACNRIEALPLRVGEQIIVQETDGTENSFLVASIQVIEIPATARS